MLGNGYGWVAALLILLNLSYLIRRRFGGARMGSMAVWLDIHVFTGLLIASLVSFHSTFQLRTPIATTSTISLAVVVITGVLGRFLHFLAPANTRVRLEAAIDSFEAEFPGMREDLVAAMAKRPGPAVPANANLVTAIASIPAWRAAAKSRKVALAMMMPHRMTPALRRAEKDLYRTSAADARAAGISALMRTWRGLHRFFALLMIIAVLLHALVAWHYGYRWIFA
jgi:cytochrome b561